MAEKVTIIEIPNSLAMIVENSQFLFSSYLQDIGQVYATLSFLNMAEKQMINRIPIFRPEQVRFFEKTTSEEERVS